MAIKVLIVDDSTFFRKRLREIIVADSAFEVCGEAKDGKEGVDLTLKLHPDVITMDVEMPVMDGITAVKEIMAKCPTPILMFSSLTYEGANSTFKALEAGAVDFMPKNFDDIAHRREDALNNLRQSIKAVSRSSVSRARPTSSTLRSSSLSSSSRSTLSRPSVSSTLSSRTTTITSYIKSQPSSSISKPQIRSTLHKDVVSTTSEIASRVASTTRPNIGSTVRSVSDNAAVRDASRMAYEKIQTQLSGSNPGKPASAMQFTFGSGEDKTTHFRPSGKTHELLAIGSSTGGPIALQNIIPKLPRLKVPGVIIQHMPASFTTTFAQRLSAISKNAVVEAKDGDILQAGTIYVAPGGMQMIFEKGSGSTRVRILQGDTRVVYHPCVDVSFASLAQCYGGRVLAIILTGMGSDGCEGARLLKRAGSVIWAQNEDTCVVYGMPQAVVNAGIAEQVLPLEQIAPSIIEEFKL